MKARAGFTLIEMLVYIALLSLLIGGTLLAVYNLLTDVGTLRGKVNTDEEANFVLRKIDWALIGANSAAVASPVAGSSGPLLQVTKSGFTSNPIKIDLNSASSSVRLSRGGGSFLPLSTANAAITSLNFDRTTPGIIRTTFVVNGRSFELVKYLRP